MEELVRAPPSAFPYVFENGVPQILGHANVKGRKK